MTSFEFGLLNRLRANGPQTPGELASDGWHRESPQLVTANIVTANLYRLRARGFVRRHPDGIWHLSPEAREVLDA